MILYGIKNCNTVKSAIDWLNKRKIKFDFHDYKTKAITEEKLKEWSSQIGWEPLINKRGTTWRQFSPALQAKITTEAAAVKIMKENNSVIKRPVIEHQGKVVTVGFDETEYKKIFG